MGALVTATTALAGCASPAENATPEVIASINGLVNLPPEIAIAHTITTAECLRDAGFPVPLDSTGVGGGPSLAGVVGLFSSAAAAREIGYSTTLQEVDNKGIDGYAQQLTGTKAKAFQLALWGDGTKTVQLKLSSGAEAEKSNTGCFADADRKLYGSVRAAMTVEMFVNDVTHQASTFRSDMDGTLQRAMPKYESCMSHAGYEVQGLHAAALAGKRFGQYRESGQAPSTDEQALAVTDYNCQTSARVAKQVLNIFAVKAAAWLRTQQQYILVLRERVSVATQNARKIIADRG